MNKVTSKSQLSKTYKCRKTKLSKKSVEDLVNIILRKDDIERRNQQSINNYKAVISVNEKRIETVKDSLAKAEEYSVSVENELSKKKDEVKELQNMLSDAQDSISRLMYEKDRITKTEIKLAVGVVTLMAALIVVVWVM